MTVPAQRVSALNDEPINRSGKYVLYWMVAFRRKRWNHALERACEQAEELRVPIVVFEPLRVGYRWANERHHAFVLDGMRHNATSFEDTAAHYLPYVEREEGQGKGLLEHLARDAAVVVTDDYPCFFLPRMTRAAAERLAVRLEAVDSNGLLPVRLSDKIHARAHGFRRFAQKNLASQLAGAPKEDAIAEASIPSLDSTLIGIDLNRWPVGINDIDLAVLPIAHDVATSPLKGGEGAGRARLRSFLQRDLAHYGDGRNHPDEDRASGLSPWLHFGHLSAHEVFSEVVATEDWSRQKLPAKPNGSRHGWWQLSPSVESFLDELITWRELGYSTSALDPSYDQFDSLPEWAKDTLAQHANDPRNARDARAAGVSRVVRRPLERGAATTGDRRPNAQLPANAVGKEDPRMVGDSGARAGDNDRPQQQVRTRRARPQLVLRHLLDIGSVRSSVGSGTPDLRQGPVHELGQHKEEAPRPKVPRDVGRPKPAVLEQRGRCSSFRLFVFSRSVPTKEQRGREMEKTKRRTASPTRDALREMI